MNFKNFPTLSYDIDGLGNRLVLTDFTRSVKIQDAIKNANSYYMTYTIRDGERPDVVSNLLYGRPDLHWTFFLINEGLRDGISGWPLDSWQFDRLMTDKYDSFGVITFLPQEPSSLHATFSSVPIGRFKEWIRLYKDGDPSKRARISHYDFSKCQLWFDNNLIGTSNVDLFIEGDTDYRLMLDEAAPEAFVEEWEDLELEDKLFRSAPPEYSFSLAKYAPYQFWFTDEHTDQQETLDAWTAVTQLNSEFITWLEAETIINDKKQLIKIIDPERIYKFAKDFNSIITQE